MRTRILFKRSSALCGTLLAGFLSIHTGAFSQELPRTFQNGDIYPEGRLEIGTYGFATKYLGEFTDNNIGEGFGLTTRYTLPSLPELSIGARYTHGFLRYDRRYQSRFGTSYLDQYPGTDFPDAKTSSTMRSTKIDSYELLAYLNLFPHQSINYYLFAGGGVLAFQPQDIVENPVMDDGQRRNYYGFTEGNQYNPHGIGGLGIDWYVTPKISLGIQTAIHVLTTDYVDGFAGSITDESGTRPSNMDAYGDFGVKLSYNFFTNDDLDKDGLSNDEEKAFGTDIYSADSDADGVADFEEVRVYASNPLIIDTDKDGLRDNDEAYKYHTSLVITDSDQDELTDFDEVHVYHSNPLVIDSDDDSVNDFAEFSKGTNPMSGDTDGDGIPDNEDSYPTVIGIPTDAKGEQVRTEFRYEGRDTVYVFREVKTIRQSETYTPYGINFEQGKATIREESEPILDNVANWIQNTPGILVEVRGHTDSDGSEEINQVLSEARALAVKDYLISQGVNPNQLEIKGFGEYKPVADNEQPKGKARNRRIEFFVKSTTQQALGE